MCKDVEDEKFSLPFTQYDLFFKLIEQTFSLNLRSGLNGVTWYTETSPMKRRDPKKKECVFHFPNLIYRPRFASGLYNLPLFYKNRLRGRRNSTRNSAPLLQRYETRRSTTRTFPLVLDEDWTKNVEQKMSGVCPRCRLFEPGDHEYRGQYGRTGTNVVGCRR